MKAKDRRRARSQGPPDGLTRFLLPRCLHVCDCAGVPLCVFVCLRGDSVVDLMGTKLIRDFASQNFTAYYPFGLRATLATNIAASREQQQLQGLFHLNSFILSLKEITQAREENGIKSLTAASSVEGEIVSKDENQSPLLTW